MKDIVQNLKTYAKINTDFQFRFNSGLKRQFVQIGIVIHNSILTLLEESNGLILFQKDDIDGYKIFSLNEIISKNKYLQEIYEDGWDENKIIFCEIIGEGNYIAIDKNGNIYDGFHEIDPKEWPLISNSLEEFLQFLVKNNGNKFWLQ